MTIRLKIERTTGAITSWGDFSSVDEALYVAEIVKKKISDMKDAILTVEHTVTSLESILLSLPSNTVVEYAT